MYMSMHIPTYIYLDVDGAQYFTSVQCANSLTLKSPGDFVYEHEYIL